MKVRNSNFLLSDEIAIFFHERTKCDTRPARRFIIYCMFRHIYLARLERVSAGTQPENKIAHVLAASGHWPTRGFAAAEVLFHSCRGIAEANRNV